MNNQWYTKKWVGLTLHLLLWILFFGFPYLLRPATNADQPVRQHFDDNGFYILLFLNNLLRLFLFYINAFVLIPRLVSRKKYAEYIFVLVIAVLLMLAWDNLFFHVLLPGLGYKIRNFFVFNLLPFFFIILASTVYRMVMDKMKEESRIKERETENLKTELSFLRSQVSPHFMFNVLNNMVALARKKSDLLEPSLIKLSSLLRYMLYETDEDKVPVEKEVEYLQNYIDLQKQRFGKNIQIIAAFDEMEKGYTIEPMLLIPFVENAFKHGTGLITDAVIDIQLHLKKGVLNFSVKNRYNDQVQETRDKTSGIGLNNVKRRLNLLYNMNHSLRIEKTTGWFTVFLHLNLH